MYKGKSVMYVYYDRPTIVWDLLYKLQEVYNQGRSLSGWARAGSSVALLFVFVLCDFCLKYVEDEYF